MPILPTAIKEVGVLYHMVHAIYLVICIEIETSGTVHLNPPTPFIVTNSTRLRLHVEVAIVERIDTGNITGGGGLEGSVNFLITFVFSIRFHIFHQDNWLMETRHLAALVHCRFFLVQVVVGYIRCIFEKFSTKL